MNVVIVLNQSYPVGMACTKRVHLYARGLVESGVKVNVIIPKPKDDGKVINNNTSGVFEGVPYRYSNYSSVRSKSFLVRRITDLFGPLKAALLCLKMKPDSVLMVSSDMYHMLLFKFVCISIGCRYYKELNEVPFHQSDSRITSYKKAFLKFRYALFDGIIAISKELADLIIIDLDLKKALLVIPIISNFNDQDCNVNDKGKKGDYLLYTGSLLERKDGILSLLKIVSEVKLKYPDIKLYITGNVKSSPDYSKVFEQINVLNIAENVVFTGYVDDMKLCKLRKEAALLVLTKPQNRQNEYNFPTKIAEYLSSGTPVLTTKVGPIQKYLVHNKEIFFASGEEEFVSKIKEVIEKPEEARKIGMVGRKRAKELFDYKRHSLELKNFFKINLYDN